MLKGILALCVFACALVVVLSAPKAKAAPKLAAKSSLKCRECHGKGNDCKDGTVKSCNTKCYKFTGISDDTSKVPVFIWPAVGGVANKKFLDENKGKPTTFRGCAPRDMMDMAGADEYENDEGCTDDGEFDGFGFRNTEVCLCKKESC